MKYILFTCLFFLSFGSLAQTQSPAQQESFENKMGLLYFWSPAMPLSKKGYYEAIAVAKKLHIRFIPVMDPYLCGNIQQNQWHGFDQKKILRMGVLNHFPAVLVFYDYQIISPLRQGYDEPQTLEKFVRAYIQ